MSHIYYWSTRLKKQLLKPALSIEHLALSLEAGEQMRPQVGGGEEIRATFFQQYASVFDLMIHWQLAAENTRQAFEYLERSRARILLDQLAAGKIDLWDGIEDPELRLTLQKKESEALTRKTELQQRITLLRPRKDLTDEEKQRQIDMLFVGVNAIYRRHCQSRERWFLATARNL